jgi:hypothetical protein
MKLHLNKPLPKAVLAKMSATEHKKFATLQKKSDDLGEEMVEAQRIASIAIRKEDQSGHTGKPSAPVQRLINNGFRKEFYAFKAADSLRSFKDDMRTKYL